MQAAVGSAFIGGGLQLHGDYVLHPYLLHSRESYVLPVYVGVGEHGAPVFMPVLGHLVRNPGSGQSGVGSGRSSIGYGNHVRAPRGASIGRICPAKGA
ncbi:MAG: hypothetical protein E6J90_04065 [Deltaproteobacteria bacterium]|nr:MAG: hypothetical protein E6J90_04065 [Deltaproteobacteria bacterium]